MGDLGESTVVSSADLGKIKFDEKNGNLVSYKNKTWLKLHPQC